MVPDALLHEWVRGLPPEANLVVVSLLGEKPNGANEFSFYSFFHERLSFQNWLDQEHPRKTIKVIEHPTCDSRPVPHAILASVATDMNKLLLEGRTVVLMDSGGIERTGYVCKYLGAVEDSSLNL